jgi:hypothetical protein
MLATNSSCRDGRKAGKALLTCTILGTGTEVSSTGKLSDEKPGGDYPCNSDHAVIHTYGSFPISHNLRVDET